MNYTSLYLFKIFSLKNFSKILFRILRNINKPSVYAVSQKSKPESDCTLVNRNHLFWNYLLSKSTKKKKNCLVDWRVFCRITFISSYTFTLKCRIILIVTVFCQKFAMLLIKHVTKRTIKTSLIRCRKGVFLFIACLRR
jgi:hypothetical protein